MTVFWGFAGLQHVGLDLLRVPVSTPSANFFITIEGMDDKRAFLTGITGQDGSYLAELLLSKGYEVHGLIRRSSSFNRGRLNEIYRNSHDREARLHLHYGDVTDANGLMNLVSRVQPTEVYNLAAQSHVRVSFDQPVYTAETVALGALKLLEATREFQQSSGNQVRFYQASSSEMFGNVIEVPQTESTPFHPRSPYAVAKAFAHQAAINYRESYGIHATCGILFNHESPRRGETFVTRKITRAATRIKVGLQEKLFLGNLEARRDWGFAKDYVEAMWLMLQQDDPDDYVVATGQTHSVRDFCERAFARLDLDYRDFVEIDKRYYRPSEAGLFLGDASKAREKFGWKPQIEFDGLVAMMVDADLELSRQEIEPSAPS